jgi:two-component system response regulator FlrC
MGTIFHTDKAMRQHPQLLSWLKGLGRDVRPYAGDRPRAGDRFVIAEGEAPPAPRTTLMLMAGAGRVLVPARDGAPARLGYGPEDRDFSHHLAAALLGGDAPAAADPGSLALCALSERVAASDITVLVNGPTGTGKEVIARHIHASSPRAAGPFIAVNCAALPEAMLEALLFGHVKGAFTGASAPAQGFFRAADGGTLLLDEIAEMPLGLQAKLLRVLQEREVVPLGATAAEPVDVRVIACANRDLPAEVAAGRFRADLYYRLSVFPLATLALSTRPQDVAALTATMILRHAGQRQSLPWPDDAALAALARHDWPGNVRELENVIQRALLLSAGDRIGVADIVFDPSARPAEVAAVVADSAPAPADPTLGNIVRLHEVQAIRDALAQCNGNRAETARRLGISERTLRYRLARMREAGETVATRRSAWA